MADQQMNQMQLKYARQRAQEMLKTKTDELTRKHTIEGKYLDDQQRREALMSGRFTVSMEPIPASYQRPYDYHARRPMGTWCDLIRFDGETIGSFDQKAFDEDYRELMGRYNTLMDELMLGGYSEALKLLKQFEAL